MVKYKRASNFSKNEELILVKLILEKKHIFQNKKTDAASTKLKAMAWNELANKFNALTSEEARTAKVLREKYKNIKRCLRKEKTNNNKLKELGKSKRSNEWREHNSLFDDLNEVLRDDDADRDNDSDTISFKEIGEHIELKEEIIDYFNEQDAENVEALGASDISSEITFADIGMQINEEKNASTNQRQEQPGLFKTSKPKLNRKLDISDISVLRKQILEQQLHHAKLEHEQKMKNDRLEHRQRMLHYAEEHKIKMKILETELESKNCHSKNMNKI